MGNLLRIKLYSKEFYQIGVILKIRNDYAIQTFYILQFTQRRGLFMIRIFSRGFEQI